MTHPAEPFERRQGSGARRQKPFQQGPSAEPPQGHSSGNGAFWMNQPKKTRRGGGRPLLPQFPHLHNWRCGSCNRPQSLPSLGTAQPLHQGRAPAAWGGAELGLGGSTPGPNPTQGQEGGSPAPQEGREPCTAFWHLHEPPLTTPGHGGPVGPSQPQLPPPQQPSLAVGSR